MAGERRLNGGSRTAEWDGQKIEILGLFEHFSGELRGGAGPRVGEAVFAWVRLEKRVSSLTLLAGIDG